LIAAPKTVSTKITAVKLLQLNKNIYNASYVTVYEFLL